MIRSFAPKRTPIDLPRESFISLMRTRSDARASSPSKYLSSLLNGTSSAGLLYQVVASSLNISNLIPLMSSIKV